MNEMDLSFVERAVEKIGTQKEKVLELLQAIQAHYGYLPAEALERLCELTQISPAAVSGVSSFYDMFRHQPAGRYTINVCVGTACHVKGGERVYDAFLRYLNISAGQDTDAQRQFTVAKIACLGCCTLAPAVQIEKITYGHLTAETVPDVVNDFLRYEQAQAAQKIRQPKSRPVKSANIQGEVRLGLGSCCVARGSGRVRQALEDALEQTGIKLTIKRVGCVGMCHQTPLVEVVLPDNRNFLYARVQPEDAKAIITRHFPVQGPARKLANSASAIIDRILVDSGREPVSRHQINVRDGQVADFLQRQVYIATEHRGHIDPVALDEYLQYDGFKALQSCFKKSGQEIIAIVERSGLRGRGGAGFPTHSKWSAVRAAKSEKKYVVCNGDEGDPGAFMDRMLMESYPFRIIEGITIAAYAVGAAEGYLYIRAEYPLAIERISNALQTCRDRGLLGDKNLQSGFSLSLKIVPGAGAFVCGEETALMASIEGRRGMPRLRPPYPAQSGLWGRPTLINNVETYCAIPWIIRNGPDAFASLGTAGSKGTKVFALAGKIARGGLIEVPMGISIRQIIEEIGGGIAGGLKFKAVQIGGPSGGCVPEELAHTCVDYEALLDAGAMMGSGGMVVLDESDCMVDIARYFLQFTQNQSCGKCTFCRIGTRRMLDILERICSGQGKESDIEQLEQLARTVQKSSLCGLGKTAPNPVLSTLKYFRNEYQAHIEKRCPAGRCKALITYSVTDDCIGCTLCAQHCPADAIAMTPYQKHEIDPVKCIRCGTCKNICPAGAIKVQ